MGKDNFKKIGGVEMNVSALTNTSQEEFISMFKGKLYSDITEAWQELQTHLPAKESAKEEAPPQKKWKK